MRRVAAILAIPVLLLGAAACTAKETDGGVATAGRTPAVAASNGRADWRAYAQCMRDHGVEMADVEPAAGRVPIGEQVPDKNDPAVRRAVEACQSLAPAGVGRDRTPLSPAELAQAVQFTRCLREHGLTVTDPDPEDVSGPRVQGTVPDRDLAEAWQACRNKAPQRWADL